MNMQKINVDGNRDLKLRCPMHTDYGSSLEEAFMMGKREITSHYRAILSMYKEQKNAIVAKHEEEIEVNRIQSKLKVLDDMIELSALKTEKERLQADLRSRS
ncbi:unnamed protein product [Brassica oleracea var. botrytis]|nr:unnamed protein product [Brassica oleracea]